MRCESLNSWRGNDGCIKAQGKAGLEMKGQGRDTACNHELNAFTVR